MKHVHEIIYPKLKKTNYVNILNVHCSYGSLKWITSYLCIEAGENYLLLVSMNLKFPGFNCHW